MSRSERLLSDGSLGTLPIERSRPLRIRRILCLALALLRLGGRIKGSSECRSVGGGWWQHDRRLGEATDPRAAVALAWGRVLLEGKLLGTLLKVRVSAGGG